jgi:hypothetical protein
LLHLAIPLWILPFDDFCEEYLGLSPSFVGRDNTVLTNAKFSLLFVRRTIPQDENTFSRWIDLDVSTH